MKLTKKGFTLIELMVVITVIAILAAIALFSFTRIQKQARDARRKSEMKTLATALQAYYTDNNLAYPDTAAGLAPLALNKVYIGSVPVAPAGPSVAPNIDYTYVSTAPNTYALCVQLEIAGAGLTAPTKWVIGPAYSGGRELANANCVESDVN